MSEKSKPLITVAVLREGAVCRIQVVVPGYTPRACVIAHGLAARVFALYSGPGELTMRALLGDMPHPTIAAGRGRMTTVVSIPRAPDGNLDQLGHLALGLAMLLEADHGETHRVQVVQ